MLRLNFKKILSFIHLWLGLLSGLVVFIVGFTGCIYTFSDELKALCYKQRLYIEVPGNTQKLPFSQLLNIAERALGKDRKISRAEISQKPGRSYMFRAMKLNRKAFGFWNSYVYYDKVYLNPYTGQVLYIENAKKEFFTLVLAMHMNLMLGDVTGHFIVKWSVVCFILLLLSGIVLWWPKKANLKSFKKGLLIKWNAKFKRLNYDLHNVTGFYVFFLLLIIGLTGLMWSFGLTTEKKSTLQSDTTRQAAKLPADLILQKAIQTAPGTAYFLYNFPTAKAGTINLTAYQSERHLYDRISYKFDRYSGELLMQGPSFKNLSLSGQLIAMNYDLHTGTALGLPGKIMAFLASLVAGSLPLTGLFIWLHKKKKKNKQNKALP